MIDWLFHSLLPISVTLLLILCFRKSMLNYVGSTVTYYSWLILPLSIIGYQLLPHIFVFSNEQHTFNTIDKLIVTSNQTITQITLLDWVAVIYWSVCFSIVAFSFYQYFIFQKKLTGSLQENKAQETLPLFNHLTIHLPPKLSLRMSNSVQSPMISGLIHPKLVLPARFFDLYNHDQQKLILEHEICHFDRNDIYWNLIAFSFVALFWFHPLVWLAYFKFRQDQELSCDQTVLARKHLNSRINYSRALLLTAQHKPAFTIARISFNEYGDKNVMLERINQIKLANIAKKSHALVLLMAGIILLSGISYAGGIGNTDAKHKAMTSEHSVYPIMRVEPKYPINAAKNKVEGAVLLKFDINANGDTENIKVVNAKPEYVFDQEAIRALKQWKYKVNNNQASHDYFVQLDFRMDESSNEPIHLVERIIVSN